jgi:small nuclear ribonucleoprotein (snRNP)-like protein
MQLFDRYPTLRRVIVNTKTDRAFRGVLWRRARGYLVLREAEILKAKGETTPMDGEVMIESSNVDFIQVVN